MNLKMKEYSDKEISKLLRKNEIVLPDSYERRFEDTLNKISVMKNRKKYFWFFKSRVAAVIVLCVISASLITGVVGAVKTNSNKKTEQAEKGYPANEKNSLNIVYDYDTVISLCNDACQEFARAVKDNDEADFALYIDNENLLKYMQYRVKNYPFSYNEAAIFKPMVTEVRFNDDYVLVNVQTGVIENPGFSMQGINHFLIRNLNGRLYIADWYWDDMDSPDTELRGEFSEEDNLTYWEKPEKYEAVLNIVSDI